MICFVLVKPHTHQKYLGLVRNGNMESGTGHLLTSYDLFSNTRSTPATSLSRSERQDISRSSSQAYLIRLARPSLKLPISYSITLIQYDSSVFTWVITTSTNNCFEEATDQRRRVQYRIQESQQITLNSRLGGQPLDGTLGHGTLEYLSENLLKRKINHLVSSKPQYSA